MASENIPHLLPDDARANPAKVFVGGLGQQTTDLSLKSYFSQFGTVEDAAVVVDKLNGRSRGFGFCTFLSPDAAARCLSSRHKIDGVSCEVRRAIPREVAQDTVTPYDTVSQPGKAFVGGLAESVTEEQLGAYFARFGRVKEASLMYDKSSHRPRGFGFVTFENVDVVHRVLGPHPELSWMCEVKLAEPRPIGTRIRQRRHEPPDSLDYRRHSNGLFNSHFEPVSPLTTDLNGSSPSYFSSSYTPFNHPNNTFYQQQYHPHHHTRTSQRIQPYDAGRSRFCQTGVSQQHAYYEYNHWSMNGSHPPIIQWNPQQPPTDIDVYHHPNTNHTINRDEYLQQSNYYYQQHSYHPEQSNVVKRNGSDNYNKNYYRCVNESPVSAASAPSIYSSSSNVVRTLTTSPNINLQNSTSSVGNNNHLSSTTEISSTLHDVIDPYKPNNLNSHKRFLSKSPQTTFSSQAYDPYASECRQQQNHMVHHYRTNRYTSSSDYR